MANISRDTFDVTKKYVKVLLQQGVPWVDADFNEFQDIERNLRRLVLKYTAGTGTPDDGFQIKENSVGNGGTGVLDNEFIITPGYFFVEGWIGWLPSLQQYNTQDDWLTWDGGGEPAPQVPFVANPPVLSAPPSGLRTDKVVLCLWENEIDQTEDPNIVDPTLLIETSRRKKMMAFIYVTDGAIPASNDTHKFLQIAEIARQAGKDSIEDADITDLRTDLTERLTRMDELVDEVETARTSTVYGAHGSLDARIESVDAEVNTARGSEASLDARLNVALENDGQLKLDTQEDAGSKETNTQVIDFTHALDVTAGGSNDVVVAVDESEMNASLIPNTPAGLIAAVTIQGAIDELDSEKIARDGTQELTGNWDVGNYEVRMQTGYFDVASGTAPITVLSGTKVSLLNVDQVDGIDLPATIATILTDHDKAAHDALNIDADTLDSYNPGNASGNIPINNGTVCVNLNADQVDGYHPGYLTGNIAINGGGLCATLNADFLDSQHGSYYLARANHTGTQGISTLSDHTKANHDSLGINAAYATAAGNADTVDTYHAGNSSGQVPVSNGTVNTNLNAEKVGGYTFEELVGILG